MKSAQKRFIDHGQVFRHPYAISLFQRQRRRSGRWSGHTDGGSARGVADTNVVDQITTQNDDSHRTRDAPVRATVAPDPFVKPLLELILVAPNRRGAGHDRFPYFIVIMKNASERELFPGE